MLPKRRESKKSVSRKPLDKPNQFCMDIKLVKDNGSVLVKNRDLIKKFVSNLYQSKRLGEDKMNEDEINIILDTKGKKVCVSPLKKVNSMYIKFENIHEKITPDMLKVNNDITLGKPFSDILKHHLEVDDKIKVPKGLKWVTLSHNGPYFTWIMEPYEPIGTDILYDGKSYKLNAVEEEIAGFYAKRLITDETAVIIHTENALFNKNFWTDFKKYLTPDHKKIFTNFSKFDFSNIISKLKELKTAETSLSKREKKIKTEEKKAEYGYAIVNGVKEKIGGFVIESSSIFLGRGKNKITGSIKRNIRPDEVTINIGKKDNIPKPPSGYKWKEVVNDQKAQWIAKWQDPLNNQIKYIYLSAEGQFKSESDAQKFEKSRKLNKYIDYIRKGYKKAIDSTNLEQRQLGTVVYLVDNYGIRIGGANDDSTADTFGASTLLVEHIKLQSPNKVTFEFLGKDSVLYKQTMSLPERIFKNLNDFIKGKKKNVKIFDQVTANTINNYLQSFDKDISAKVFRTRLGSSIMHAALEKTPIKKTSTESEKRKVFENANILVANALNHQRSIPKSSEKGILKLQKEIKELEKELKDKKGKGTKTIENKIEKKKAALDSTNNLKSIALSTSKINYIDPRLVVAWCKKNDLDLKKVYTVVLQRKFKWAIDTTGEDWDYFKSPMLTGFEKLQPKDKQDIIKVPISKSRKDEDIESSGEESDSDDEKPFVDKISTSDKSKKIALLHEYYKKLLKNYGYSLVLHEDGKYILHRVQSKLPDKMRLESTYKEIYDFSIEMKKNNMEYLMLLLIWAVCRDSIKHNEMKKIMKSSGYLDKYIKLVKTI